MRYHDTLKASDNKEVMLFPLEYMNISQGEGESYSHLGSLNVDFLGWNSNGRKLICPYYAPCSLKCVAIWDSSSNNRVYESVDKVHLADGSLDYVCIAMAHDNTPLHNIGDIINQGDLLGHTGTFGKITGDHVHMNTCKGHYDGYVEVTSEVYQLKNSSHIYDTCFKNNTIIIQDLGYNWKRWGAPPIIRSLNKSKFPFVLYADKLRNKNKKSQHKI